MQLKVHGTNQTTVTTREYTVFFSYDLPVVVVKHGNTQSAFVTSTKHSRTTSKHINQYKDYLSDSTVFFHEPQEHINNLANSI